MRVSLNSYKKNNNLILLTIAPREAIQYEALACMSYHHIAIYCSHFVRICTKINMTTLSNTYSGQLASTGFNMITIHVKHYSNSLLVPIPLSQISESSTGPSCWSLVSDTDAARRHEKTSLLLNTTLREWSILIKECSNCFGGAAVEHANTHVFFCFRNCVYWICSQKYCIGCLYIDQVTYSAEGNVNSSLPLRAVR